MHAPEETEESIHSAAPRIFKGILSSILLYFGEVEREENQVVKILHRSLPEKKKLPFDLNIEPAVRVEITILLQIIFLLVSNILQF